MPELSDPVAPANGALEVLNWAGKQAAISYTFDDGTSSQVNAYSTLNSLGVRFTFYLVTDWNLGNNIWKQVVADGHEIGNHSKSHPESGTADQPSPIA